MAQIVANGRGEMYFTTAERSDASAEKQYKNYRLQVWKLP